MRVKKGRDEVVFLALSYVLVTLFAFFACFPFI